MTTKAFKIPEEVRYSQSYINFWLTPRTTVTRPLTNYIQEIVESYKRHIKQKREDERPKDFPEGTKFIEPPIKMRIREEIDKLSSAIRTGRTQIPQEKDLEFRPVKMKDLIREGSSYILVADSGFGKSTLLKELQYQMVTGTLPAKKLPLYFEFRDLLGVFSTESLLERIRDLFPKEKADIRETVDELFQQKGFIFLLDSLDQVEDMSNLPKLLGKNGILSEHSVILAGRPYVYSNLKSELFHYDYLTLDTFSPNQAEEYLGRAAYTRIRNMIQDSSLRAPMLLLILKELGSEANQDFNRTAIYETVIDKLLVQEARRQTSQPYQIIPAVFKNIFNKLSYELLVKECAGRFPWTVVDSLLPDLKITWGDFVRLTHLGLISEIVEGTPIPGSDLVFRHQSFQEYFAAQELKKLVFANGRLNRDLLIDHLEYNRWDEVIYFLIGSLEEDEAGEIISFISDCDLFLAGKCIAHYRGDKDGDFRKIIDRLFEQIHASDAREALAKIGTEGIINRLIPLLEDKDVRWAAAWALGNIGSDRAVDELIPLLRDEDKDVRMAAAEALGMISSERAVDELIPLLRDEDKDVRMAAAEALGMIGSERTVAELRPLLKDENVCWAVVVETLGGISAKIKGEKLLELVKRLHGEGYQEAAVWCVKTHPTWA